MRLLIVDDDVDLCHMLQEHFEHRFDAAVFTANTASEALRLLEELQPEGVLLDVNLKSKLTGFDILARVAQLSPNTKAIMVTSVNDFESIEQAMALGAVDYITKPFAVEYLEETVDGKIAQHLVCA